MAAILDGFIEEKDNGDSIFGIEKELLGRNTPNIWNVHNEDNMERLLEVDFQKFAISVTELTGQDLTNVSTFAFYASVEHLKEKFKKRK